MDASIVKRLVILLNNVRTNNLVGDKTGEDQVEIDMKAIDIVEGKNKEAEVKVITMNEKDIRGDIEGLDNVNTLHMNTNEEEITEDKDNDREKDKDKDIDIQIQDLDQDLIKIPVTDVEVKIK